MRTPPGLGMKAAEHLAEEREVMCVGVDCGVVVERSDDLGLHLHRDRLGQREHAISGERQVPVGAVTVGLRGERLAELGAMADSAARQHNVRAKVGVLGASGYTGAELIRLLLRHPTVEIALLTAERRAGQELRHVFPQKFPCRY